MLNPTEYRFRMLHHGVGAHFGKSCFRVRNQIPADTNGALDCFGWNWNLPERWHTRKIGHMQIARDSANSADELAGPIGHAAQIAELSELRF